MWGEADEESDEKDDKEAPEDEKNCTGAVELSDSVQVRILHVGPPGILQTELFAGGKPRFGEGFLPQGVPSPISR